MSDTSIFKTLASKETWSIDEVIGLLCGPCNSSSVIRGEINRPLGELLETAANQGRFGMLAGSEPYRFLWDLERLQDRLYPDEPLDTISDFQAHCLRFTDWIEDKNILDEIKLDTERREKILRLIETVNNKRPEVSSVEIDVDYAKLIEEDLWSLTDLRFVLFGETYSSRYWPNFYHKYNVKTEALMQKIDKVIQDAATVKRYLEAHKLQDRKPLIDSGRDDENEGALEEFGYFGFYDTNENGFRSMRYYYAPDLFNVLSLKGFPVPKGLATALGQNQIEPALGLLKALRENIRYLAVHGKNPPNIQVDPVDQKSRIRPEDEAEQDLFEKEGDFWIVSIEGEECSGLKDCKGMSYISHLFKNKGEKFHVVELERLVYGALDPIQYHGRLAIIGHQVDMNTEEVRCADNTTINDIGKMDSYISPKDLKTLLDNKASLELELNEAINTNDIESKERIEDELERLRKAMNIVSFAGKGRSNKPEIERFRQRIQRTIKDAIDNINDKNPNLGQHLSNRIKTGEFCFYHP